MRQLQMFLILDDSLHMNGLTSVNPARDAVGLIVTEH